MNFHSPRCRITATTVIQGSTLDVATAHESFFLKFDMTLDQAIWFTAGYFYMKHAVFQDGQLISDHPSSGWTASHLVGRPNTSLWIGQFFARADEATKGRKGIFIYRPSIEFDMWGPGLAHIPNEFAVAEQEHYFTVR